MSSTGTTAAIDATLTTCPSPPRASIRGTKVRTPWTTPIRLTRSTASQSSRESSQVWPWRTMPALLQTTSAPPKRASTASARCLDLGRIADVDEHRGDVGAEAGQAGPLRLEAAAVDVGEHHPHARVHAGFGDPQADAAGRPRHHRHLARQLAHAVPDLEARGSGRSTDGNHSAPLPRSCATRATAD